MRLLTLMLGLLLLLLLLLRSVFIQRHIIHVTLLHGFNIFLQVLKTRSLINLIILHHLFIGTGLLLLVLKLIFLNLSFCFSVLSVRVLLFLLVRQYIVVVLSFHLQRRAKL